MADERTIARRWRRSRARRDGADARGAEVLGDAAAVLAGDLLLAEATRLIAVGDSPVRAELLDLLDDAILVSSAGELTDVQHAAADALPASEALLSTAHDKTAVYSFRAPVTAGAADEVRGLTFRCRRR